MPPGNLERLISLTASRPPPTFRLLLPASAQAPASVRSHRFDPHGYLSMNVDLIPPIHSHAPELPIASLKPTRAQASRRSSQPGRFRRLRKVALIGLAICAPIAYLARPAKHAADALTSPVRRGDLPVVVTERGELDSTRLVVVRCEVEGAASKLVSLLPEGTPVVKGQEVGRFDTDELQKRFADQEIRWKSADGRAKAAIGDYEVQKNRELSEIDKAELALDLAKITLEKYQQREFAVALENKQGKVGLGRKELKEAEDNLDFTRSLVKKGFLPLEQVRVQELAVEQKRIAVREAEAELGMLQEYERRLKTVELAGKAREAERQLTRTRASQKAATERARTDVEAAETTVRLEKQTLDRIQLQIDRCVVKAPQAGIVVYFKRGYYDETTRIQAGATIYYQQPIFTLPDLTSMKAKVKIHESVIKKIAIGQSASLQVDALPNHPLTGTVKSVGTIAQSEGYRQTVKEYLVEIEVLDLPTHAGLKPGMTAEVRIHVQTVAAALMVPLQAVTEYEGASVCYVQTDHGLERSSVEIGESNDQYIQVLAGLLEGDPVALDARSRAAAEIRAARQ